MAIQAKMVCEKIMSYGYQNHGKNQEEVTLAAVYSDDEDDPNYSYSKATPQGHLELTVDNEDAWGYFEPGVEYVVEIRKYQPQKARK